MYSTFHGFNPILNLNKYEFQMISKFLELIIYYFQFIILKLTLKQKFMVSNFENDKKYFNSNFLSLL
jgi:hypothetical protein